MYSPQLETVQERETKRAVHLDAFFTLLREPGADPVRLRERLAERVGHLAIMALERADRTLELNTPIAGEPEAVPRHREQLTRAYLRVFELIFDRCDAVPNVWPTVSLDPVSSARHHMMWQQLTKPLSEEAYELANDTLIALGRLPPSSRSWCEDGNVERVTEAVRKQLRDYFAAAREPGADRAKFRARIDASPFCLDTMALGLAERTLDLNGPIAGGPAALDEQTEVFTWAYLDLVLTTWQATDALATIPRAWPQIGLDPAIHRAKAVLLTAVLTKPMLSADALELVRGTLEVLGYSHLTLQL